MGIEKRTERWSEDEIGGRTEQECGATVDGTKTRSIVDGVPDEVVKVR